MRSRAALIAAVVAVVVGLAALVTGVWAAQPEASSATGPAATSGGTTSGGAATSRPPGVGAAAGGSACGPWGCAQVARFAQAAALIKTYPGHIGLVVRDRTTGAVWETGEPAYRIWAGSTPKLAFAVSLLEESAAGQLTLDQKARDQITAMLHVSDDRAADTLWDRYANAHSSAFMSRFVSRYGMATASYVTGFPSRWGFVKCSPEDLTHLMSYVLEKLAPSIRTYIEAQMTTVGDIQHWGVWGAGAAMHPGVKDGWSIESDAGKKHWITATVGFVGPDQRYVVAAMYHQFPGGDTIDRGVHALTDLVATVFGAPVPAPATIPNDF